MCRAHPLSDPTNPTVCRVIIVSVADGPASTKAVFAARHPGQEKFKLFSTPPGTGLAPTGIFGVGVVNNYRCKEQSVPMN